MNVNDVLFSPIRLNEFEILIQNSVERAMKAHETKQVEPANELLTVPQAAKYLNLAVPTIYSLISRNEIPCNKPKGTKKVFFVKSDLIAWINSGRKQTISEIKEQAGSYMGIPKKRKGQP